ncbi:hypothetical protein [Glycomyces xiaoerkulensis]|nr:hypothetical protein [Glycomyces xiaoerkulensis]
MPDQAGNDMDIERAYAAERDYMQSGEERAAQPPAASPDDGHA